MEDPIGQFILTGRGWDNQCEQILGLVPAHSPHVIEVGANIGASLLPLACGHPELQLHCFEPVPEFFELLQQNRETCNATNTKLINKACGARRGEFVDIYVQTGTAGALRDYDGHRPHGQLRQHVTTIDHYAQDQSVGLIKIDVDGHELAVLNGARETLEQQAPMVFMEFHTRLIRSMGAQPEALLKLLGQANYKYMRLWNNVGDFIADTSSYQQALSITDALPHYADILFSKTPIAKPF